MPKISASIELPLSASDVFHWFEREASFDRLYPLPYKATQVKPYRSLNEGEELELVIRYALFKYTWKSRIGRHVFEKEYVDEQKKGPFKSLEFSHQFHTISDQKCNLSEHISYELAKTFPFLDSFVQDKLKGLFRLRHKRLKNDLEIISHYPSRPLKVAITGASGLVGTELTSLLKSAGHEVLSVTRKKSNKDAVFWDPQNQLIEKEKLENLDAVINLAGENIASGLWTSDKKKKIQDSRIESTKFLVKTLNDLAKPPKTLISASASGYYGLNSQADENSEAGSDFLAKLCQDWELAALSYKKGRVVLARIGLVLSSKGGALAKMLPSFSLGLGGAIGKGEQMISWISIDDLTYALYAFLCSENFQGVVNCTSPEPVSNKIFSQCLAKAINRPCIFKIPPSLLRAILGEMAKSTLLASQEIKPQVLLQENFPFQQASLQGALHEILCRF